MNKQLLTGYLKECKSGEKAALKTYFRCSECKDNLYFTFDSQEIFPCPKYKEYNKPLYEGDTVEVFLSLDRPNRYLEVEVNQIGGLYSVIIDNKDSQGDIIISKLDKPVFKAQNQFENDKWQCFIEISKKELEKLGWQRQKTLINACRQDFDSKGNLNIYALFPTYSETFHKVKAFEKLYKGGEK